VLRTPSATPEYKHNQTDQRQKSPIRREDAEACASVSHFRESTRLSVTISSLVHHLEGFELLIIIGVKVIMWSSRPHAVVEGFAIGIGAEGVIVATLIAIPRSLWNMGIGWNQWFTVVGVVVGALFSSLPGWAVYCRSNGSEVSSRWEGYSR